MEAASKKIYVVQGSTGVWDDFVKWNVCAFTNKTTAELHVQKANEWLVEKGLHDKLPETVVHKNYKQFVKSKQSGWNNPYDPECQVDYTGTDYEIIEVPFIS